MEYQTVQLERQGRVGIVRLNRPEFLNAFNTRMNYEWGHAFDTLNDDPTIGAIVLTGNGRGFCAGGDLGGFERAFTGEKDPDADIVLPHSAWDTKWLASCKPLIAAVNGIAIGGGLTSILWFDRIIASTEARFAARFSALGLTPELNSQWLLPRIIGIHNAREMFLTGRIYSAQEAKELGLVRHVVEPDQLMPTAIAMAEEICRNSPESLRAIKQGMYEDLLKDGGLDAEARSIAVFNEARKTVDHREALLALRERREPQFYDPEHMAKVAEIVRDEANRGS